MTGSSSQAGLASFRHRGLTLYDRAVLHARNILGPTNWGDPGWDEYQALINEYVRAHEQEQDR